MVLHPPTYSCPDDHSDLTGLVTEALSGDGLAVARFARPAFRLPTRRHDPAPAQPFEVIVTCPGPAGQPRPHQLTCTGTRTLTVTGLPATEPVTVLARGGSEQCRSSLGTGSAPPTLSCAKAG